MPDSAFGYLDQAIAASVDYPSDPGKKRIAAVVGKRSPSSSMEVVSFIFLPKDKWELADAKDWLRRHNKKAGKLDETKDSYRFRQQDPDDFTTMRTILITDDADKMTDVTETVLLATTAQDKRKRQATYDALAIAMMAAEKITNRYAAAVKAVVEDMTPRQLSSPDLDDELTAALFEYSDGQLDRIADETVNEAFLAGRIETFVQAKPQLEDWARSKGEGLVWRRSAVLDHNTCGPCKAADGSSISGPDQPLYPICEGVQACRCVPFCVVSVSQKRIAASEM